MPTIHLNYLAIAITVVANFIFGFLWFTPLFGKAWAKELGFDTTQKPPASALMKGMLFGVIGNFLMAFVFAHNIKAWDPESWGQGPSQVSDATNAIMAAIFTWLGFYLPGELNKIGWEGRSWKLFFINSGYQFISLLIAAFILVMMK